MTGIISDELGKFYQQYPTLAVVVTAQAKGRRNAMAVAWHALIAVTPPIYGIAIRSEVFTYPLIIESREFGVNFLPFEEAELVASVGGSKGEVVDKFKKFNIEVDKPVKTAVPILKAAYAAYECKLVDDRDYGDHKLLVGEIVAAHQLKKAFTSEEILDFGKVSPTLYIGHEVYVTTSKDTMRSLDREVYGKV